MLESKNQIVLQTSESDTLIQEINQCIQDDANLIYKFFDTIQPINGEFYTIYKEYVEASKVIQGKKEALLQRFTNHIDTINKTKKIELAQQIINAYLLDIRAQDKSYRNLLSFFKDDQTAYNKAIKVFQTIGREKLQMIIKDPTQGLHVSVLEKISHYFNQSIHTVTCGYIGYEFSTLEAKEAIKTGFDHAYQVHQKDCFIEENYMCVQDMENNTLLIKQEEIVIEFDSEEKILPKAKSQVVINSLVEQQQILPESSSFVSYVTHDKEEKRKGNGKSLQAQQCEKRGRSKLPRERNKRRGKSQLLRENNEKRGRSALQRERNKRSKSAGGRSSRSYDFR